MHPHSQYSFLSSKRIRIGVGSTFRLGGEIAVTDAGSEVAFASAQFFAAAVQEYVIQALRLLPAKTIS